MDSEDRDGQADKTTGGCDYNSGQFVARKREIQRIEAKIQAAIKGIPRQRLLVEFYGVAGLGKSWLLHHLQATYSGKESADRWSALVDFEKFATKRQRKSLLNSIVTQLQKQRPDSFSLPTENWEEAFVKWMSEAAQSRVPLLLFDTSEKSSALLDWLESAIIYPLLRTERIVFVFAGRRWLRWKRFEVRRRVEIAELTTFDLEPDTSEMLEKLGIDGDLASVLYRYAFGHPRTTRAIVDALHLDSKSTAEAITQHKDEVAQAVADVIEHFLFQEINVAPSLRQNLTPEIVQELLWIAAIPRKFDVTPLKAFAKQFESDKDKAGGFYLDAIRAMQESTLVQWRSEWGGYALLPVLRRIMARNMEMREPKQFRKWHQKAMEQYQKWVEDFPRNAVSFVIECAFHHAWTLRADGATDDEIAEKVGNAFQETWQQIAARPDVQWDLPEMVEKLEPKITQDQEIETTFPKLYNRLVTLAEKIKRV